MERKCWLDMVRLWAIHMTHDPYTKALSARSSTLQTIIASYKRSQQVRKKLQLRQLALTSSSSSGAGIEGQRLPVQYAPLTSTDDDDELASGVLSAVSGIVDETAVQVARLTAARRGDVAQQRQQQQGDGDGQGQLVTHLPPANGAEDVYTLLKMYSISAPLVSSSWWLLRQTAFALLSALQAAVYASLPLVCSLYTGRCLDKAADCFPHKWGHAACTVVMSCLMPLLS
jgi:hypothetical protein